MKKNLEIISIAVIGFVYLIAVTRLKSSYEQGIIIINYACDFFKVIFATSMLIVAFNHLDTDENCKPSYLALSYFLLIFIMVVALNVYNNGVNWQHNIKYLKMKGFIGLFETLWVFICTLFITSKKQMVKWIKYQMVIIGIMSIVLLRQNTFAYLLVEKYGYEQLSITAHVLALLIIVLGNSICMKKVRPYTRIFKYYWCVFISLQVISHSLLILFVLNSSVIIFGIGQVASVMCYICTLNFIEHMTLTVVWREMDKGIVIKLEQLNEENVENQSLIQAANSIEKKVREMNIKAKQLKVKLECIEATHNVKYVEKISNNCNRLTKLSKNIVDLNNIERGKGSLSFQMTNLTQLVEVVAASVEPYMERLGIRLEYKKSTQPVYAVVDAEAIERVVLNLISNAIKYNKKNGSIQVYVTIRKQRAFLCVKDTGIGIPKDKLQTMFNRFERGDSAFARRQEGSGLGLAIVKSIIDLHQGEIKILSTENKGTLISISLPACDIHEISTFNTLKADEKILQKQIEVEFSDLGM